MRLRFRQNRELVRELETERFVLRPVGTFEAMRDPGGWRRNPVILNSVYLGSGPMSLRRWLNSGPIPDGVDRFLFAIVPKGSERAIGYHFLRPSGYRSVGNMVGLHDKAWWGKDVVVEVRARLMNHFFAHGGIERFTGKVNSLNTASIYTYRKLGYAHVGTQHREKRNRTTGEIVDFLLFEMFKDQWMAGPYAERAP
jgi:RimJ/RimL family protein N-acetyltransferase